MLQVSDFEAAGRGHGPSRDVQYDTSTLVRLLQFARASSVPAGWKRRRIGKGVRGFKLVMVSAVKLRCHVPVNPSLTLLLAV